MSAGSEARLWAYLRGGMRGRWHAQRHEDRSARGVPDVSYGLAGHSGWIELKHVDAWPVRDATPVRVGLTQEQAIWLTDRAGCGGGQCFVLLKVGRSREYLLFGHDAVMVLAAGKLDRMTLKTYAVRRWADRISFDELHGILAHDGFSVYTRRGP